MKKTFKKILIIALLMMIYGCDEMGSDIVNIGNEVTEQEAASQNFDMTTNIFNIRVAVDSDVDLEDETILELIDSDTADFLNCQFFEGEEIGFMDFELEDGSLVTPLSELRIFIVPFNFECNAVDKNICAGIYFDNTDLIIISEESFGRCENLPLLKHEIAHRYGLEFNHSNQDVFAACSDPEDCDTGEFLDIFF